MILEAPPPDATPEAFGQRLQRLRLDLGLTLDDIGLETKISRRVLEALESGAFEYLPERVFSRSFVGQIARVMGCDPQTLVADFDAAWARHQLAAEARRPPVVDMIGSKPAIHWRFWFPISACAAILVVVGIVILSGSEPGQAGLVEQPRLVVQRAAATPVGTPLAPPLPVVQEAPAETEELAEDGLVDLKILVDPDEECWVRYRDREGRSEQRLLAGGESLELQLEGPVKLTVGNASAARLMVGGVLYGDLGVPGQVVHAEASLQGLTELGTGPIYD
jgi:cytoskeletal protein RodZ